MNYMETSTKNIIKSVAIKQGIEPAALLAIKTVETGYGDGLLVDGSPEILFEGHIFYKLYKEKYGSKVYNVMKSHPKVCHSSWTKKYYLRGILEHRRLQEAVKIDRDCALMSASWGLFQIMGFNWKLCGCKDIQDFVNKNYESKESQVNLACEYLKNTGLISKIEDKDWKGFAKTYNGPSYTTNHYDQKLANAYNNYNRSENEE